ncbi:hypothetical protein Sme01_57600 [Sphaerisporangium melleum]|uniref:DUF4352 domain-containing protein n=1 Tax=Sphaerisporangium melleum TaxID=321316 RepID=A0A917R8K6_9ACTN|nr:hypothetical protein [Sphaerisporangium melleum]GGK94867.1 hypothetical protein GCM10007964_41480 [Sphaerisporangium melleum]GII73284.1 hypothetical protein Sme01_57600 [Sphaerisporangium melleum]
MALSSDLVPDTSPAPAPADRPRGPRRPAWHRIAAAVLGVALAAGAVYAQTFTMSADQRRAPLTFSAGPRQDVRTDHFSARLERVEFARSVRVKRTYATDEATTDQVFLIIKIGATGARRPLQLAPFLVTADGLRFNATDKVNPTATITEKWVQPGWWRSALCFFEVPPDKIAGARVVVQEKVNDLAGDQYLPETSFDLGLTGAQVRQGVEGAKDGYEVSGI